MPRRLRYGNAGHSRVPLAREELHRIADILRSQQRPLTAQWIVDIADELLPRHVGPRKAPDRYPEPTADTVREVHRVAHENPQMSQAEVGQVCGCGAGRVSEILKGHRTEEHPEGTPEFLASRSKKPKK